MDEVPAAAVATAAIAAEDHFHALPVVSCGGSGRQLDTSGRRKDSLCKLAACRAYLQ
jgi:hypothetical protein